MADENEEEAAAPEPVIEGLTEDAGDGEEDPELEDMKRRVQEMEEEANKLKAMYTQNTGPNMGLISIIRTITFFCFLGIPRNS